MNRIFIILILAMLSSCSFNDKKTTIQRKIVYDTIGVVNTEVIYDTIRIAERVRVIDSTNIVKIINIDSENRYKQKGNSQNYYESNSISKLKFNVSYEINNKLDSVPLMGDFNGDGNLDIIYSIKHIETKKKGWLIIHGVTDEAFILCAGKEIKNGPICVNNSVVRWNINKEKFNNPGLEEYSGKGENGELILETPSIFIKTICGCGLIYWDGEQYAYFNQCG